MNIMQFRKTSRSSFQDPEFLPEELNFRQEEVWIRLESKLATPVRKRRFTYVGLAAACLLLIVAGIVVFEKKETKPPLARIPLVKQQPATTVVTPVVSKEPVLVKQQLRSKEQTPAKVEAVPARVIQQLYIETTDTATVITTEAIVQTPAPVKPASRFRIAHVNELDKGVQLPGSIKNDTHRSIAKRTDTESKIAEINDQPISGKPRGFIGLIRANQ
jgi:hypothetical protein